VEDVPMACPEEKRADEGADNTQKSHEEVLDELTH